jgi:hypothetical protein
MNGDTMYEILKIPYGYLRFIIHVIRIGLQYSPIAGFETEREWLRNWCKEQEEDLDVNE